MTQQVIIQCPGCGAFRHYTAFTPGIERCKYCHPLMLRAQEGWVDEDGMMKDSEFELYAIEPIIRAQHGLSRERVETALKPYFDMKPTTRRPVKRRRR